MNEARLPQGWTFLNFDHACHVVPTSARKLKQRDYSETGRFPVIDQGQQFIGGYTDHSDLKLETTLPVVVFGDHTRVVKFINFDFVVGADGVKVLSPFPHVEPRFLYYFLQHVELPDKGYARHFQFLQKTEFPLPPLPEQHRIVEKIEELFSDLDAGVEALKKVKAELKRYRQAVLKAAVEGKLTEEWRANNKDKLEPAAVLLERIRAERAKSGKAKKLPPVDTSELPQLPDGWEWATVYDVGEVVTGRTPSKSKIDYYSEDFPFFKPTDLNAGYFVRNSEDHLSKSGMKEARLLPAKTVLVTCIGATIGKSGLSRVEGASNQQINAVITRNVILPEFLYFLCISSQFQKSIFDHASATTLPILNKSKFEILLLPVPPLFEQQQIVSEVEQRLSVADEVEKTVEAGLRQAERLRQSILKRAFEGKLVPQDPSDEPASVLLERIRSAREEDKKSRSSESAKDRGRISEARIKKEKRR